MGTNTGAVTDQRHLRRFLQFQAAGANEAAYELVAKAEKVSADAIRKSVQVIDGYRHRNSSSEMDMAVRNLIITSTHAAQTTLASLLNATELVEKVDRKGKKVTVREPDKTTRLEAVRVLAKLIADQQPKVPLVHNEVKQTTQAAFLVPGAAETTEERMRRLRAQIKQHNALPPEVAGVPEYIDNNEDEDDGDDDEDDGDE